MKQPNKDVQHPLTLWSFLPNLVTLFAVCIGLTSIRLALNGRLELAVIALVVAMVLDGIDGRLARALNSQSELGAELDSLADFFNFGIAPGLILYLSIFSQTAYANLSWVAVMFLAVCCAYRLARFNVVSKSSTSHNNYFEGVPAPLLAFLSLIPVYIDLLGYHVAQNNPILTSGFLFFCGYLAASRLPTISGKSLSIPPKFHSLFIVSVAILFACILVFPWESLTFLGVSYILYLPIFARRARAKMNKCNDA